MSGTWDLSRGRIAASWGVVAALVVAVWAAFAASGDGPPPTTTSPTAAATSVSISSTTTSTLTDTTVVETTTTAVTSTTLDPAARREAVRLIVEDLYFRWFDAIYHDDEEAAREVVALTSGLEAFERATEDRWSDPPSRGDVVVRELEILEDSERCLAVEITLDLTEWRGPDFVSEAVDVLRPYGDGWRFGRKWASASEPWEADCEADPVHELP